ncbi:MAG: Fe-Mn family superoxide dismutase [Planctomycetota bacterium]|jgi:Fe-Mn family superoxide dismutase
MYTPKEFTIPELDGISQKNIEEHLGLYRGYVKNTNMILTAIESGSHEGYALSELQRRFSFEFNGMRNHEYYFRSLEGGSSALDPESDLAQAISGEWGSFDAWLERIKVIAKTRGVGWAILGYDTEAKKLLNYWVEEQHWGHLNSVQYIAGIDMWEHAFVADYQPSGKGNYIDDYFAQVNWTNIAERFNKASD